LCNFTPAENWHGGCNDVFRSSWKTGSSPGFPHQHSEQITMGQEKIAVLYGNNADSIKMEAARLMTEAFSRPDEARSLISMAIELFDYANTVQEARA
jgi:hypothetical protein